MATFSAARIRAFSSSRSPSPSRRSLSPRKRSSRSESSIAIASASLDELQRDGIPQVLPRAGRPQPGAIRLIRRARRARPAAHRLRFGEIAEVLCAPECRRSGKNLEKRMVRYDPRRHRRVLQAGHRLWHAWIGIGWRAAPLSRGGDADKWRKRRVEAVGGSPVPNSRGDLMSARDALVDRRGAFARSDVGQRRRVAAVQCRLLVRRRRARPINFRKNLVRGLNHRRGPRRAKAAVGRSDMNGRIAPIDRRSTHRTPPLARSRQRGRRSAPKRRLSGTRETPARSNRSRRRARAGAAKLKNPQTARTQSALFLPISGAFN